MKKFLQIILIIVALFGALFVFKGFILKQCIALGASNTLGAKVKIKSLAWKIFDHKIVIREMKIFNPKGYPKEHFIHVARMEVDYEARVLLNPVPKIKKVILDVQEVVVIKAHDKSMNVNALNFSNEDDKKLVPTFPLEIELLQLNVANLVHKDYSKEDEPVIKAYDVGLEDKEFKNIKSAKKLVAVVVFNTLRKQSIKGIKYYSLAAFLGPTFIPVGLTGIFIGKDHADREFDIGLIDAYSKSLEILQQIGEDVEGNEEKGVIKARVSDYDITTEIEGISEDKTKIKVSARKLGRPKPEFAGGILYQIGQEF